MSRPVRSLVSIELPLPPSVNKAFAARRSSHLLMKTAAYRAWLREVEEEQGDGSRLPVLAGGKYGLWIDLPANMLGDVDGRIKLTSDVLEPSELREDKYGVGVVGNDRDMDDLHVCRRGAPPDRVIATVVTLADWPSYLEMRLL